MPELKFMLTEAQITRIKKAIRNKYGDDERTDAQLVKDEITNHLKFLVRGYEQEVEVRKINLVKF